MAKIDNVKWWAFSLLLACNPAHAGFDLGGEL